jgi:2-polyprenyl-3-methyl-5-hydroxy-6-metoxy-1,4-benzoquinol methylase
MQGYESNYLVKCSACSFVFAQKIPTTKELNDHYTSAYTREDYLSPITVKRYHEILDKLAPFRQTGNLLDIGCGVGYFLEVAKERGWQVYGTEYTDESMNINLAKGFCMNQGKLNPENYSPEFFDVITSFEVIEHINNPLEEMGHINQLLRKGGLFYCTTPNFNSLLRFQLGNKWNVIAYPEHLSYYTPKTINHLLVKTGFKKLAILTTGISITRFKKSIDQTVAESHLTGKSTDENLRIQMESKWYMGLAKKLINALLTALGVGDSLKVYYVKK